jgi:hypothetical protein
MTFRSVGVLIFAPTFLAETSFFFFYKESRLLGGRGVCAEGDGTTMNY